MLFRSLCILLLITEHNLIEAVLVKIELLELFDNLCSIHLVINFRLLFLLNEQIWFGVRVKMAHVAGIVKRIVLVILCMSFLMTRTLLNIADTGLKVSWMF